MGNTASFLRSVNMFQTTNLLLFVPFVLCLPPQEYPTPAPTQEYNPDIGQTNVGGYGVNKDPYCHMGRKLSSRTNASLTPNKLAGHKTRKSASLLCTKTALESSRLTLNAFASM